MLLILLVILLLHLKVSK